MRNVVRLAALSDPATPAHVLATIAAGDDDDDLVDAYLLAHPNTPAQLLAGRTIIAAYQARHALTSPALTDATHARVLAACDDDVLRALLTGQMHRFDPHPVTELAARQARTPYAAGAPDPATALLLMDHPWADADTQLTALHILTTSHVLITEEDRCRLRLAATRHPKHLRTLATNASNVDSCHAENVSRILTKAADQHDAGINPEQALLTRLRHQIQRGNTTPHDAVISYPDAQLALELYTAHPDNRRLLRHIKDSTALTASPAWRLANLNASTHQTPDPTLQLPVDVVTAAALHGTRMSPHIGYVSTTLTRDGAVLAAACAAIPALTASAPPDAHDDLARHVARLLVHPHTPTNQVAALRPSAYKLIELVGARRSTLDGLRLALDLTAAGPGHVITALASIPLGRLAEVHGIDRAELTAQLAHRAAPLLRPLWTCPDTTRAALALPTNFPGTLNELASIARTITT